MKEKLPISGISLLPFLVFIIVFLGTGIILDDFYAFPAPIAAIIGVLSAFFIPKFSFSEKIDLFLKGCGDKNILTMCIIYLLAGAFATTAKGIGSVDAVVDLGVQYLSPQYIPVGVFIMASFLSVSAGTSVGTIVALTPIVLGLATRVGLDINVVGAALLCGAMFGDNLSFISDTTIAATQSLGCSMRDKFKTNIYIALPAAFISALIFMYLVMNQGDTISTDAQASENSLLLIIPYFIVIILSFLGVNVFLVLIMGVALNGILGIGLNVFSWLDFSKKIYEGFNEMNEVFLLALFTGGLAGIVDKMGGINYLLYKVKNSVNGARSALLGIGGLVGLADAAIANNTIAIVLVGKIAKKITEEYELNPRVSASVLDIFSCIVQGLIPYGAQVLILIGLSENKIDYWRLISHTWYLYFLFIFVVGYIFFSRKIKH